MPALILHPREIPGTTTSMSRRIGTAVCMYIDAYSKRSLSLGTEWYSSVVTSHKQRDRKYENTRTWYDTAQIRLADAKLCASFDYLLFDIATAAAAAADVALCVNIICMYIPDIVLCL